MDHYDRFSLNFSTLSDSKASNISFVQDLNSASSLSWAEDEVENLATLRVDHCLCLLDEYLLNGCSKPENEKCFDVSEADQWRELITQFRLYDLLNDTKRMPQNEELQKYPVQKKLEIQGHRSFVHSLPTSKQSRPPTGSTITRTPRVQSAFPPKTSGLSANTVRRGGTRSGYANQRLPPVNCIAVGNCLNNVNNDRHSEEVPDTRVFTPFRRAKQPPLAVGQFEGDVESVLPPINNARNPVRIKVKPKISNVNTPVQSKKSAVYSSSKRQVKSHSDVHPPTFHNSKVDLEVSVIGTSFDPIVRPLRMKVRSNATANLH